MSEPIWREDPGNSNYRWAVEEWNLRHQINGDDIDVAEEWGVEMGTSEKLRDAIKEVVEDSATRDVTELIAQLMADVDRLEAEQ